jgi:Holliday junction resolvase-like predicted endonuclease
MTTVRCWRKHVRLHNPLLNMLKSSRHSKITGNFGEALILYWLSKRGFECAHVDHTGIDLIARRPASEEVLGISVKCRSRAEAGAEAGVNLLHTNDEKIESACQAFGCVPYVAVVVDQGSSVHGYLTTLNHLRTEYPGQSWRMASAMRKRYESDQRVEWFKLASQAGNWLAER